jgi:hypothetical protein
MFSTIHIPAWLRMVQCIVRLPWFHLFGCRLSDQFIDCVHQAGFTEVSEERFEPDHFGDNTHLLKRFLFRMAKPHLVGFAAKWRFWLKYWIDWLTCSPACIVVCMLAWLPRVESYIYQNWIYWDVWMFNNNSVPSGSEILQNSLAAVVYIEMTTMVNNDEYLKIITN